MISTHKALILIALTISLRYLESFKFPSDIELCHRTDNDCIVKTANKVVREHAHGYPDIALEEFEPFRLSKIEIVGNSDSPINFNLLMTDIVMHGYSNMTFKKISGFTKDPSKVKLQTECINSRVKVLAKYKISGRLLILPISGEGDSEITIYGLKIRTRDRPTYYVKDGKTHLKTTDFQMQIDAENMKIHLTNLFNGDKILGESMLSIMNENWKLLWDELSLSFNKAIAATNAKMFDVMYSKIPYEDMFLPD